MNDVISLCPYCICITNTIKGFCCKCKKYKLIKIRKLWKRNPKTQITPNKKKQNRQQLKQELKNDKL